MSTILRATPGILVLQFFMTLCFAQKTVSDIEIGLNAGTYIYQGDLTPSRLGSLKTPALGMMVFAGKRLTNHLSARVNLAYTKLKGDESRYKEPAYRQQRNFNFTTRVLEFSALGVWEPLLQSNFGFSSSRLSPYVLGGVALAFVNVKRDWSNFNQSYFAEEATLQNGLIADSEHKLPNILPAIPLGIGLRYALHSKIDLHAESVYRLTRSDYLDGFSKSANPSHKDAYYSISAGLTFRLGRGEFDCPVVDK